MEIMDIEGEIKMKQKDAKDIKLSIIVPVYKVEKYLRKCIDSILCQSFEKGIFSPGQ